MGYLSELIDGIRSAKRAAHNAVREVRDTKDELIPQAKTFAGRSLDGTLQFPMLVSDTISIGSAATLARTMERVYASFAQTVISMNSTIDISEDRGPAEFLKRFHHNVRALESVEETEDIDHFMEMVNAGTYSAFYNQAFNIAVVFNESDEATAKMLSHNRAMMESVGFTKVASLPQIGTDSYYREAPHDSMMRSVPVRDMMPLMDVKQPNMKDSNITGATPQMTDRDVKKENDLQPYTMAVKLMAVNDKKEFVQFMDFVMGIKVVLHNVKSDEVISNTIRAISNNGAFYNFLRWTTGEKSLFGDLLLNINDIKLDASNRSKGASRWWSTLKRMKERKVAYNNVFSKSRMIPNATLAITEFEVEQIKERSGFDLNDPKIALKLVNSLFLMTFIIVSDSTETFKVIYADAGQDFQYHSLEVLEKEVQMKSNTLGREIVRMIGK